jgi:CcmD family protein
MGALAYVGAAYFVVWILLLAYAWRMTATAGRLSAKVDELERSFEAARRG